MAAEIRYVALKPLSLQDTEGGRLHLQPGEEIPEPLHGRWLGGSVEAGKVAEVAVTPTGVAGASDDELRGELERRGYRVARPRAKAA